MKNGSSIVRNSGIKDVKTLLKGVSPRTDPFYTFIWGTDLSGTMRGAGGVGGLLAWVIHTGTYAGTYFYVQDGNGNITRVVRVSDGAVMAEYDYDPFGRLIRATGPLAFVNPFRFSSKYIDDETGLVYYGYRYYNATFGTWLSRDPIEESGGMNLYCFIGNDTPNHLDVFGLKERKTLEVEKCNIVLFYGHIQDFINTLIDGDNGSSCRYGGVVACYAGKGKGRVPNLINVPGYRPTDKFVAYKYRPDMDNAVDAGKEYDRFYAAARLAAKKICQQNKCGCEEVTIRAEKVGKTTPEDAALAPVPFSANEAKPPFTQKRIAGPITLKCADAHLVQ